MKEMDDDGSGEVDFEEFYQWWTSDKESAVLKKAQDGSAAADFDIEPYN
jgi:Ca2+-binding EF-hand superfamily protein